MIIQHHLLPLAALALLAGCTVGPDYRDGLITYLEVATAQSTASSVEFSTTQRRGQQLAAAVALVKSLGGRWQESK